MKRFFLLCMAVVAIVSCTDDGGAEGESPAVKEPLAIDATSLNFLADGGTNTITFTASEAWSAELINTRADGWCSIEPTSGEAGNGKITVTTTANTTPNDRSASIVIKAGTASKTIAVTQKQKDAITITTSKFEVAAEGGEVTIELQSNVEFSVAIEESGKSWITHQTTRAMTPYSIVLDVEENTDTEKREADVIISAGNLTERVTIYQAGDEPSIVISKSEYLVPSVGETIAVEVRGDIDVEFEIPADVEWITENTTCGESTNTFYFDIAENEDHDQRTAEIKFTDKTNNLSETVKVTQSAPVAPIEILVTLADTSYLEDLRTQVTNKFGSNATAITHIEGTTYSITLKDGYTKIPQEAFYGNSENQWLERVMIGNGITSIGDYAFVWCTSLESITIPNSVTSIEYGAFCGCESLESITIPDSVTSIGDSAFYRCSSLESVTIPNSVTSIGEWAFYDCTSLESITIPNSVTSIGNHAFCYCRSLESITIPNSVTSIGNSAFSGCTSLESITIPNSVTSIGKEAFSGCTSLESITIPNSVTSIGSSAFYACTSLESITIPNSVTSIGSSAFGSCTSLESITIPNSVTSIGYSAFEKCSSLKSITIPNSVTSIGYSAFEKCSSLKSITIPDSVTSIGESAFYNCESLESITIPNSVTSIGERAFYGCSSLKSVTIPNSVTSIGGSAFGDCSSLKSVTIPESVTSIGSRAFYCCESLSAFYGKYASADNRCLIIDGVLNSFAPAGLTTYSIPNSVTSIGEWAFWCRTSLKSITIPNSVTSIGEEAFYHCSSLRSITIPNSVTSIGELAFYYCTSLESVYCNPTTPPMLGRNVFNSNVDYRKIYVPAESVNAYKTADVWQYYADDIYAAPAGN